VGKAEVRKRKGQTEGRELGEQEWPFPSSAEAVNTLSSSGPLSCPLTPQVSFPCSSQLIPFYVVFPAHRRSWP
jgi:hypothetical protein